MVTVREWRNTLFYYLSHVFFSRSSTVYIHFESFVNHRRNDDGVLVIGFGLLLRKGAGTGTRDQVTFLSTWLHGRWWQPNETGTLKWGKVVWMHIVGSQVTNDQYALKLVFLQHMVDGVNLKVISPQLEG